MGDFFYFIDVHDGALYTTPVAISDTLLHDKANMKRT